MDIQNFFILLGAALINFIIGFIIGKKFLQKYKSN